MVTANDTPVLEVIDLSLRYQTRQGEVQAVEGVSFELARGQSLGLVGESGCGKTSVATSLMRLAAGERAARRRPGQAGRDGPVAPFGR